MFRSNFLGSMKLEGVPLHQRSRPLRYVVRYFKGALLVHFLRESLGDDGLFARRASSSRPAEASRAARPSSGPSVRAFWKTRLTNRASELDTWLDSPGGLPNQEVER
jgi:hypothetical protein